MQVKNIGVHELLSRLRLNFQENDPTRKYANEEPPLRAELYNTVQLEQLGKYLASIHKVRTGRAKERLLKRLARNERILVEVRNLLMEAINDGHLITPAGEWLLDNFYLIEDHIRTGKRHLPKGYSEGLPRLVNGASTGFPRSYDIALEIISHSDGRIDQESLTSFIVSYQSVANLQLGELWAIPIMLRLALIENLRRVAARVAIDRINQNLADYWANLMTETAEKDPKSLILVIADMARSGPPLESSFVAELIRQLMWKGPSLALPLTWMEQRLSELGLTSTELVNIENQKQAADQVSISNSIASLRLLGSIEWRDFVESMSEVEQILRTDASGIYPRMDFSTRDHYRHIVERIAKNSGMSESEIASIAIQFAKENAEKGYASEQQSHVGYYLAGDGLALMDKQVRQIFPFKEQFQKLIKKFPLLFYAGNISIITLLIAGALTLKMYEKGLDAWAIILAGIISVLATSHFATIFVNWASTLLVKPSQLPRMDFSKGIPIEYKTLVVVPTMLTSKRHIERLTEALEIRYLANRDENLYFGLLTDFTDADAQTLPEDAKLLSLAQEKIEELNERYNAGDNKFFLFHRPRKWNPYDKIWMGYERKRGKLSELNSLLRGKPNDYFSAIVGNISAISNVKYIITLDTDTQLPRDVGWKLTATMAHPLNHPYYDEKKMRVTRGYGILQPRVSISLSRAGNSRYSRMHGNEPGIDPYTRLTSDVYQDLFNEGSFIGKGIYDIDAFDKSLNGRFPENRILSHDLLEGCYTRAGLLSDVQLYEEYPLSYSADVNRRHRWTRGDWQIAYWALPFAPDAARKLRKNPVSALSRWKIFDNLRRSLVPVALTAILVAGWTFLHAPIIMTLVVIAIVFVPSLVISIWNIFRKPGEVTIWQHIITSFLSMSDHFLQNAFLFICLPYEAFYSLEAIVRTTWRMLVSHKKLLEWNPSGNQEHTSDRTITSAYRAMWFSPIIATFAFVQLTVYSPLTLIIALPVQILWLFAPMAAWWLSRPFAKRDTQLNETQTIYLRKIARKTWAFFENFVTKNDNWLPPDNFQERPNGVIAHRTSPTNIGLSLLANLSAYDFGYITMSTLLERTSNTFTTLESLERYQGHLYNWYDTVSLMPLKPKYVSTVDSGNMAGHLLTLRQGVLELAHAKIIRPQLFEGLLDTVRILEIEIPGNAVVKQIRNELNFILSTPAIMPATAKESVTRLSGYCGEIMKGSVSWEAIDAGWWLQAFLKQCDAVHEEILYMHPWLGLAPPPEKFRNMVIVEQASTLTEIANLTHTDGTPGTTMRPATGKGFIVTTTVVVSEANPSSTITLKVSLPL